MLGRRRVGLKKPGKFKLKPTRAKFEVKRLANEGKIRTIKNIEGFHDKAHNFLHSGLNKTHHVNFANLIRQISADKNRFQSKNGRTKYNYNLIKETAINQGLGEQADKIAQAIRTSGVGALSRALSQRGHNMQAIGTKPKAYQGLIPSSSAGEYMDVGNIYRRPSSSAGQYINLAETGF